MTIADFMTQHPAALAGIVGVSVSIGITAWMALCMRCEVCKHFTLSRELETRVNWSDERGWRAVELYTTICTNPCCMSTFDAHTAERAASEAEIQTMLSVR